MEIFKNFYGQFKWFIWKAGSWMYTQYRKLVKQLVYGNVCQQKGLTHTFIMHELYMLIQKASFSWWVRPFKLMEASFSKRSLGIQQITQLQLQANLRRKSVKPMKNWYTNVIPNPRTYFSLRTRNTEFVFRFELIDVASTANKCLYWPISLLPNSEQIP